MSIVEKVLLKFWDMAGKGDKKRMAEQSLAEGIEEVIDIPYIDDGNRHHMLDIYYPKGTEEPLPVIFNIHGGGFMYGDKELNKIYNTYIAKLGFAVVNISYRLVPDVYIQDQIYDILHAMHWFAENGKNYPCDMNNIFITGDSAGGYFAAMTTMIHNSVALQKIYDLPAPNLNIRAVGLISPVIDFSLKPFSLARKMFFGKGYETNEKYKAALIESSFQLLDKPFPPAYIVTSAQDLSFVHRDALFFTDFLKKQGVDVELHDWPKSEDKERPYQHVFSVVYPMWPESVQTNDEMKTFLLNYLA